MPNIKSAKKRVKVINAKTLRNKMAKSELKTILKKVEADITEKKDPAALKLGYKKIDQAVAKGLLHKNTGARKKAALATLFNSK